MPNEVTALSIVLSFLILSVAFRQVRLLLKLKDLFEVDLKAKRKNVHLEEDDLT
ncbi:hypothetical protein [Paenibacillus sp. N3.4]|uniref:hypothetical protein n=1 Tax=Paenibacillus sp. N3.4 TaxID=2603222 RepID=UPI00164F778E|nr:hypothetical protein [Paenibacillus sp. N3.4]